jgi:squalene-hopene/tetraprenyl-beta-curcumene cyclase
MRSAVALVVLAVAVGARGQTPTSVPKPPDNPYPYSADEPKAKALSLAKAAEYLDGVAAFWMRPNSCGACHANFPYLMARPLLAGGSTPLLTETRQFLEARKPRPHVHGVASDAEVVAIAFALARDDARAGGEPRPATREALRRVWAIQRANGTWGALGCGEIVPAETDRYYTAVLAVLAAGVAPEGHARTAEARDGMTKLRRYFAKTPARNMHDEAMLLWASMHVDGLMTTAERAATVQNLLRRQRPDGGWSFATLSDTPPYPKAGGPVSDGYGTGLAVFVLRQAGVPATRTEIARGVGWLRANQRASGRWFTPTPTAGQQTEGGVGARDLYLQNLGTAFAVLALAGSEGAEPRPARRAAGLALRERLRPE